MTLINILMSSYGDREEKGKEDVEFR